MPFDTSNLETGDVILFSTNKWYSDIIEIGDECIYSHCGIVLKDPTYIDSSLNGLYLLESGVEPFPDVVDHQYHFGVQIVPLINVVNEYVMNKEGSIYHRSLKCKRDKVFQDRLLDAYQNARNKPYNCDPLDWLEALLGYHFFDRKITSRFWCSALVAYVYVKLNIIDDCIDWTLVTPREWASDADTKFVFLDGCILEKEIRLI